MVEEARDDAPNHKFSDGECQQALSFSEARRGLKWQAEEIEQDRHANENDYAGDAVRDWEYRGEWESDCGEIDIYWSGIFHV